MQKSLLIGCGLFAGSYWLQKKNTSCCGIIGILSDKRDNIADSLTMGVQLLKNRGYDSAGIVTFGYGENKNIETTLVKHAEQGVNTLNCIERLVKEVTGKVNKCHVGIGHTRWATCGEKVQKNAHPHFDDSKKTFIVHNGIIGGHSAIKSKYLPDIKFNSDTDSEVVAQLIGKFKAQGLPMIECVRKMQDILRETSDKPQWGIVIIDEDYPNKMWTTTDGSPILIGMNDSQIFVASESIAFKKEADSFFVTGDGEIFELEAKGIPELKQKMMKEGRLQIISKEDKKGVLINPPQPYKSFYSYEIRQQGSLNFNPEFDRVKAVPFGPYLSFIACGSSYYAALASHYFFKKLKTFQKISLYDPAELMEGEIEPQQTVVLISQSGETKDLINVISDCQSIEGVKTIGIINVQGSTIARKVDFPIYIKVGREVSVAATKSMFHQMMNLIMLAIEVAQVKQSAPKQLISQMTQQLMTVTTKVTETIGLVQEQCDYVANLLYKKESIYILAMRQTMAIAKEAALKIKQLNYIHAEALGACEMKHGPIALIESEKPKETPIILFILDNDTFQVCANAFDQMRSRNAQVIIVTNCKQKILAHYQTKEKQEIELKFQKKMSLKMQKVSSLREYKQKAITPEEQLKIEEELKEEEAKQISVEASKDPEKEFIFIQVPPLKYFSNILTLIPMQILVQKISQLKGINPDMPRNLAKTVTV